MREKYVKSICYDWEWDILVSIALLCVGYLLVGSHLARPPGKVRFSRINRPIKSYSPCILSNTITNYTYSVTNVS